MGFIKRYPSTEKEFSEACWERAKELIQQAGESKEKIPKKYFQMRNLNQYNRDTSQYKAKPLEETILEDDGIEKNEDYFSSKETNENGIKFVSVFNVWLESFDSELDRAYIKDRYISYMQDFEFNDSSDIASLMNILGIELLIFKNNMKISSNQIVSVAEIEKLSKTLMSVSQEAKLTKKTRGKINDVNENNFTKLMNESLKAGIFVPPTDDTVEDDKIEKALRTYIKETRNVGYDA